MTNLTFPNNLFLHGVCGNQFLAVLMLGFPMWIGRIKNANILCLFPKYNELRSNRNVHNYNFRYVYSKISPSRMESCMKLTEPAAAGAASAGSSGLGGHSSIGMLSVSSSSSGAGTTADHLAKMHQDLKVHIWLFAACYIHFVEIQCQKLEFSCVCSGFPPIFKHVFLKKCQWNFF